ncbi:trypsin-like serine protease [Streptomyces sp. cmx-4-9]|uniref:trypsin-like serine protease n=1 Tax=Streptomyces sp. cmx-4-9 TaxID=2790941 RepID=UPI003980F6B2
MRIRSWLPAAIAVAAVAGAPAPLASAEPVTPANGGAPFAVEDGAYPFGPGFQTVTGADLIAGDGNITLASCTGSDYQIMVWARKLLTHESRICFKAANTGYLKVNIPQAYRIETVDRSIRASFSIGGATPQTLDVPEDTTKGFGEANPADPKDSVLLEMRVTGSSSPAPQPPAGGDHPLAFTGKLKVGDTRSCTAALVDPRWVVTAKSCFADKPAESNTVPAGAPKNKTVLTLGRADLVSTDGHTSDIVDLVPHADRDLVLARLAVPAAGIAPVPLSAAAPAAGQELTLAGYGRTSNEWVPSKLHSATYTTGTATATGFDIAAKAPVDASLCKGDAGAPALRTENGKPALAAIASRSWQNNCFDSAETKAGAFTTRVGDLGGWISQTTKAAASVAGGQQIATSAVGSTAHISLIGTHGAVYNTAGNYGAGQWTQQWTRGDGEGMTSLTSVTIKNVVRVFGIGAEGKVFGKDFDPASGQWTGWSEIPGGAAGAKGVTATATGNTVRLNIIGTDGTLYNADANYDTGQRTLWTRLDGSGLTALTSVTANNVVHIYGIGADGKVFNKDANYNTGNWSNWVEVPGGAAGAKSVTAAANANTVHLNITGTDNLLYVSYANYDAGQWGSWIHPGDNRKLASLSSTVISNVLHLYGIGIDGRAYNIDANFNTRQWGTNWVEIPGGLGS